MHTGTAEEPPKRAEVFGTPPVHGDAAALPEHGSLACASGLHACHASVDLPGAAFISLAYKSSCATAI